jgi:hypothetical protein
MADVRRFGFSLTEFAAPGEGSRRRAIPGSSFYIDPSAARTAALLFRNAMPPHEADKRLARLHYRRGVDSVLIRETLQLGDRPIAPARRRHSAA